MEQLTCLTPSHFPRTKNWAGWLKKKKSFEEEQNNLNDIPKFQVLSLQENKMLKPLLAQMQTITHSKVFQVNK